MQPHCSIRMEITFSEDPLKNSMDFTDKVGFNLILVAKSNPVALDLALRISSKNATINIFAGMQKIQDTHNDDRNQEKNLILIMRYLL